MSVLVGKKAPEFCEEAFCNGKIIQDYSLSNISSKYIILFFYPLDFTFVCPTELHAFQEKLSAFSQRDAAVIGCSVDSAFSHQAWWLSPKAKGGIEGIQYPLIADLKKSIARDYGILKEDMGIAYRGLFLIDQERVVRSQVVNDLPLGRSIDEALRVLDALIFFEKHGEVCPANWQNGQQGMQPSLEGVSSFFQTDVS